LAHKFAPPCPFGLVCLFHFFPLSLLPFPAVRLLRMSAFRTFLLITFFPKLRVFPFFISSPNIRYLADFSLSVCPPFRSDSICTLYDASSFSHYTDVYRCFQGVVPFLCQLKTTSDCARNPFFALSLFRALRFADADPSNAVFLAVLTLGSFLFLPPPVL